MEKLLHFAWKHKILPLRPLLTTEGESVEVIDPGQANRNQGADFFNAKVKIGQTVWAGYVEIHVKASDWFRHGHHEDARYNNVVLHVVQTADAQAVTQDGKALPTLQIDFPAHMLTRYQELCQTDDYPRCHRVVASIPSLKVHSWMEQLLAERLDGKSARILKRVKESRGDWEQAAFATLARSFGFGINGELLEEWAAHVPLAAAAKHRNNLLQVQALFLGTAGLIGHLGPHDGCDAQKAEAEYAYLAHKFSLPAPPPFLWRYLRTRPYNFPHLRILQLAAVFHHGGAQLHALLEASDTALLQRCLQGAPLSVSAIRLIAINTVAPLLYAYGQAQGNDTLVSRAMDLLESLPAENNYIIRQWSACGLEAGTAAHSQALIQLKREYCDRYDCLRCHFGYEYLKQL
ncbi:MAG: DUF2851 family protein [Bacteroidaceae bacterium]|nr:DUF2851 family protein [Bacteroidaceae bacterium]